MRHAFATLVLGGCFAPHAASGVPCDPLAAACPDGQSCAMRGGAFACGRGPGDSTPDEPGDAPDGDRDGDGIADSIDDCVDVSNAAQDNYDGDRFGDACDPCPPVADDAVIADGDGDGVADACDPDPALAGDRIAMFDAFAHGMDAWRVSGAWIPVAGGVMIDLAGNAHASITAPAPIAARVSVVADVEITALRTATGYAGMGVVAEYDRAQDAGIASELVRFPTSEERVALVDTSFEATFASKPATINLPRTFRSTITKTGDAYRARADDVETTGSSGHDAGTPEIGIRARGAAGVYHWLMIVTSN